MSSTLLKSLWANLSAKVFNASSNLFYGSGLCPMPEVMRSDEYLLFFVHL